MFLQLHLITIIITLPFFKPAHSPFFSLQPLSIHLPIHVISPHPSHPPYLSTGVMNPSKCENGHSLSVDVSKPQILEQAL